MGTEIERKFLVRRLPDLRGIAGRRLVQGYLRADAHGSVRVRISGEEAWLTVKGPTRGYTRLEFEYPVPPGDAREMLDAIGISGTIDKIRYRIDHQGYLWELDVFSGSNQGLVLAEVELERDDEEPPLPPWIGREVSGDPRYSNAALAREPFLSWLEQPSAE